MHVLSYLLLQFMAAIIISATVIISVLLLNFHVCNLANLTLQLSLTSGNFPKPLRSAGNMLAARTPTPAWGMAMGVQSSPWRRTKSKPLAWGDVCCHVGHLAQPTAHPDSFFSPGASALPHL